MNASFKPNLGNRILQDPGSLSTTLVPDGSIEFHRGGLKSAFWKLFKKVFTEEEIQQIKSDKITVKFSEQQIHFDDSIGTIKIKILPFSINFLIKKSLSGIENLFLGEFLALKIQNRWLK
mgnify:CR=1 FL=1